MLTGEPDWTAPIEELLVARQGSLGRIRLNRPRPINALTLPMIEAITDQLDEFASDETITAVALDGAGDRGLRTCARSGSGWSPAGVNRSGSGAWSTP